MPCPRQLAAALARIRSTRPTHAGARFDGVNETALGLLSALRLFSVPSVVDLFGRFSRPVPREFHALVIRRSSTALILASPADVRRVGGRGCSRTGESPIDHRGAVPSSPRARVSMYLARQSTLTAVTPNCCRCNLRVTIPQQNSLCCEGPRAPEPCLARNMAWRDTLRSSRSRGGFFGSD